MGARSIFEMASTNCAQFLEGFVLPLVQGGPMHIGRPIDQGDIDALSQGLAHASVPLVAIDDARQRALSSLMVRPPSLVFDTDELYLSVSLHNLLFLAHPGRESALVTEAAIARVIDTTNHFVTQPDSEDPIRVLARHGLLHNLFATTRTDTTLTWWTGSAKYFGQTPPKRLTTWKKVRRVRRKTERVHFRDLVSKFDMLPILAKLLHRSPLTLLLANPEDSLPFRWEDATFILRDAALTRSLAYHAVGAKRLKADLAICSRYAVAFDHMLARVPTQEDLQVVAAFLVHLNVLFALTYSARDIREVYLELVAGHEEEGAIPGSVEFLSLPMVLRECAPALAEPPGAQEDVILAQKWRQQQQMLESTLSEQVVDDWHSLVKQHVAG